MTNTKKRGIFNQKNILRILWQFSPTLYSQLFDGLPLRQYKPVGKIQNKLKSNAVREPGKGKWNEKINFFKQNEFEVKNIMAANKMKKCDTKRS